MKYVDKCSLHLYKNNQQCSNHNTKSQSQLAIKITITAAHVFYKQYLNKQRQAETGKKSSKY